MGEAGITMTIAEELLRGPRGRRLCLGIVARIDEGARTASSWLAHRLDPNPGTIIRIGDGASEEVADPVFTERDTAECIRRASTSSVTNEDIRDAMCETVDHARYWQEPDGYDVLAALPAVRDALGTVAERVVAMITELTSSYTPDQWAVDWCVPSECPPTLPPAAPILSTWTDELREEERRATRDRPTDPHANVSGSWWSLPYQLRQTRSRVRAALELVEDSLGWDVATVTPVRGAGRVLEITAAGDWADLCREYPAEVTASRRHDWFRVTGRDGRWLIPDWARVAQQWDAVHLSTLAYLSAATTLIPIDREYATVMAGWAPDSTIWLTDAASVGAGPRQRWNRTQNDNHWVLDAGGAGS